MINTFKIRKFAALLLNGFLTVIAFVIGNIYFGFFGGLGCMAIGLILGTVIALKLLQNPFSDMIEGKGILALNIDSTGVIHPFILAVRPPYIKGKVNGNQVDDVFNRDTVMQITPAKKGSTTVEITKDGGLNIDLDGKTAQDARFAFLHYPVILYNDQIKSVITKSFLSNEEKDTFAEHGVLYLNRKMEELTSVVRDFGRHVVETLKPKGSLFQNKWVLIIIAVAVVILIAMFAPGIIQAVKGTMGNAASAMETATANGNAFTPR